jgi:hypothetical protein
MIRDALRGHRARLRHVVVVGAIAGALAAPGTAVAAGDPTDAQYASNLAQISAGGPGGGPAGAGTASATASSADTTGSLPFTGLDLGVMAAVAAALGVGGLAMRRHLARAGADQRP